MILTLSSLQTNTDTFANSADPDETAHNEPSHQDLQCLPCSYRYLSQTPICNNGCVQTQRWKSQFQNLRGERIDKTVLSALSA